MKNRSSRLRIGLIVIGAIFFLNIVITMLGSLISSLSSITSDNPLHSDLYEDILPVVQGTSTVRSIDPVYVTEYQEFYEIELTLENTGWYGDYLYDYRFRCTPSEGDPDSMYITYPTDSTDFSEAARDYLPAGRTVPCRLVLVAPLGSSGTEVQLQYETINDDRLDLCTIQLP